MNAIFKKDNVYVFVKNKEVREDISEDDVKKDIVLDDEYQSENEENVLYGGRVYLSCDRSWSNCYLDVDGICIGCICMSDGIFDWSARLDMSKVTAYLNQMENLGIESFLEHYKKQLQELKKGIEDEIVAIQRELDVEHDEEKVSHIDSLKEFIRQISCVIFSLLLNMNAGLDNHCYTEAYDAIINLYF